MTASDTPMSKDNNSDKDKKVSTPFNIYPENVPEELIRDAIANLNADEREMISRGVVPLRIQERFAGFKKSQILPFLWEHVPRKVVISKTDRIEAIIHNGNDGYIKIVKTRSENGREVETIREVFRFVGYLGPVLKIDQKTPGIKFQTPWDDEVKLSINDFLTHAKSTYSLTATQLQLLKSVMDALVIEEDRNGNVEDFLTSPITVIDETIKVEFQDMDNAGNLRKLRNYYEVAPNQKAYLSGLGWSILAPFHYALKTKAKGVIRCPLLVFSGRTGTGKTALAKFFVVEGFNQSDDDAFFMLESIKTPFVLMKHLSESNLPCIIDDVPSSFNFIHKDALKSYVQTGIFGDRGRPDQTLTRYKGARSFIETSNEDLVLDEDLALNYRIIHEKFTKHDADKMNLTAWNDFIYSLPSGFLISIIKELFDGQNINDLLREVGKFRNGIDWINFALDRLNTLCNKYGIPQFPRYEKNTEKNFNTYAIEIAQAFIAEDQRIKNSEETVWENDGYGSQTPTKRVKYRSKIEGEFKVEKKDFEGKTRYFIYFTGSAFKTLTSAQYLRVPYKNATEFLNNIESSDEGVRVENDGKPISKKIGEMPLKVFCISIPEFEDQGDEK